MARFTFLPQTCPSIRTLIMTFLAEALEALLNRIQVDIEVDSNLKGLKKGNVLSVCGVHGSCQRKKKRKMGMECLL